MDHVYFKINLSESMGKKYSDTSLLWFLIHIWIQSNVCGILTIVIIIWSLTTVYFAISDFAAIFTRRLNGSHNKFVIVCRHMRIPIYINFVFYYTNMCFLAAGAKEGHFSFKSHFCQNWHLICKNMFIRRHIFIILHHFNSNYNFRFLRRFDLIVIL